MKNLARHSKYIWLLVIASGMFARLFLFGSVPDGLNQDEAFAGYEAWNILTTGHDTMGYRLPVYLFTNGGGMNALETYLMIPFLAAFGMQDWVVRVPQVIIAILSMPAMYGVARRVYNERVALWALVVLAWCPWHIMLSRWGLESNLAPGMLLFGMYFFLRGEESERYYIVSAFMYGLSLYSYAMVWKYVPIILLVSVAYLIYQGKLHLKSRVLWISIGIVLFMAIPLVMVVLCNYGYMPAINSRFGSVPLLDYLRTEQTDGYTLWDNVRNLLQVLFCQTDGLIWNSPSVGGIYYSFGIVFILIGTISALVDAVHKLLHREYAPELLVLVQLMCGIVAGCTSHININRVNIIFIPMLIFGAYGIVRVCTWQEAHAPALRRAATVMIALLYLVSFVRFEVYYFTDYREESGGAFDAGLKDALEAAVESGKTIHIKKMGIYPKVLYYLQIPVDEYMDSREFSQYHPMPYSANNIIYIYADGEELNTDDVYILDEGMDLQAFADAGFECVQYKSCTYAYYP